MILLALLFHLFTFTSFITLTEERNLIKKKLGRLGAGKQEIDLMSTTLITLQDQIKNEMENAITNFVVDLQNDFLRLEKTRRNLQSSSTFESEIPKPIENIPPRRQSGEIQIGSMSLDSPMQMIQRPLEDPPLFEINDLAVRQKIAEADKNNNREELLKAILPFVETKILKPRFDSLNEKWVKTLLPKVEKRLNEVHTKIGAIILNFPEEQKSLGLLRQEIEDIQKKTHDLDFGPPPTDSFWWSSREGKGLVSLQMSQEVQKRLTNPKALTELQERIGNLVMKDRKLLVEIDKTLTELQTQFNAGLDRLSGMEKPFNFLAVDLERVIGFFPFLLVILFTSLTLLITARWVKFRQICMIIIRSEHIETGKRLPQQENHLGQLIEAVKGKEVRKQTWILFFLSLGLVCLAWMGTATWQVINFHGPQFVLTLSLVGAIILIFGMIYCAQKVIGTHKEYF